VNALFSSAAPIWGAASLALVLTGMGADGTQGALDIVAAGGSVIAQDEATSVVWGMPRSVAQAGLCSAVLPLDQIAPKIIRLLSGARS
ncbi:MAG: chemotaxis protein CheB, partial [Xanthobacteraceae bacterium]